MCVFGPSHIAPEHGPNFWRVLQDDPSRNQTNVTLLFKVHPLEATFTGVKLKESIKTVTFAVPPPPTTTTTTSISSYQDSRTAWMGS